jgi:probable S-adenosylmethionine-dependent methyltransferase, YraL family
MIGELYLVPSPIGNLKDVSPRVMETLLKVDFIACEDTRNTSKLLNLLGIKDKKCFSCHEHNEKTSSNFIVKEILNGKNVAYLSDAGYPCISDPGAILTIEAIKNDIKVVPLNGASAFLSALIASGLDSEHFFFYGFLKSKESERVNELKSLKNLPYTLLFYESPHRIKETLKDIYEVFGDRKIVVARELSKLHEEFIRTTLKEINASTTELIGELVLVVEKASISDNRYSDNELIEKVNLLMKNGLSKKDAITSISLLLNVPKNEIKKITIN